MQSAVSKLLTATFVAVASLSAGSAHAQRASEPVTGFYVGAAIGASSYTIDSGGIATGDALVFATTAL
jgi:hypothetical protein